MQPTDISRDHRTSQQIRRHYQERAYARLGVLPTDWQPQLGFRANEHILQPLYHYYQHIYQQQPERLLWAGLARLTGGQVVGFAIVDLQGHNIWALFVEPDFAKKGAGKELHRRMMNWYFQQTSATVWLGTAPQTRAEVFYEKQEKPKRIKQSVRIVRACL